MLPGKPILESVKGLTQKKNPGRTQEIAIACPI